MEEVNTAIKQSNNGTLVDENQAYYIQALKWYFAKYLKDYIYVRYLIIVVIFLGIATFLIYKTSASIQEIKRYPFPVYFKDEVKFFSNLKRIGNQNENVNVSIAEYMITNYLKKMEEFNMHSLEPENLKKRLNFIRNLSSLKVFREYFRLIDIEENYNSPLLKYRYDNARTIKVDKIIFEKGTTAPFSAKAYYTLYDKLDNKESAIKKSVEIRFLMSAVDENFISSKKALNFLITDLYNKQEEISK